MLDLKAPAGAGIERKRAIVREESPAPTQPAVRRVADSLAGMGISAEIVEFAESTRTAEEAAQAIGTTVERIVKSLVFMAGDDMLLVLTSGGNRVDTALLGQTLGMPIKRADANTVRQVTGFAIGGVPPVGHARALPVVIDSDLLQYDVVFAAAGTPHAIFPIAPGDLCRITGARILDIKAAGES
jgi:prolyl-tRNA editing enzyme YbaK/EbsC (Cys-tRNA(Pro) deacylase)